MLLWDWYRGNGSCGLPLPQLPAQRVRTLGVSLG